MKTPEQVVDGIIETTCGFLAPAFSGPTRAMMIQAIQADRAEVLEAVRRAEGALTHDEFGTPSEFLEGMLTGADMSNWWWNQ